MKPTKRLPIIAALLAFVALIVLGVTIVSASSKQSSPASGHFAATPTPTPFDAFTFCAYENGVCPNNYAFNGSGEVRYGANNAYIYKTFPNSSGIPCTNEAFGGDPIPGTVKDCRSIGRPDPSVKGWIACAGGEDSTCSFSGKKVVRFGAKSKYYYQTATNSIVCSNAVFGDPIPGVTKMCHYISTPDALGDTAWWFDANEGSLRFTTEGTRAYGALGMYNYKQVYPTYYNCTNAFFGDPIPGTSKKCYYSNDSDANYWVRCADENGACFFLGTKTVAFGASGKFKYINATGSVACTSAAFDGDPIYGTAKACYYNIRYGQ